MIVLFLYSVITIALIECHGNEDKQNLPIILFIIFKDHFFLQVFIFLAFKIYLIVMIAWKYFCIVFITI